MAICLAAMLVLLPIAVTAAPAVSDAPPEPLVTAPAAAVIDLATGQVLWSRDLHGTRAPASVTKMLTALTAVDLAPLDTKIIVQQSDLIGEASMGAQEGETLTLETLLYGMLLPSGNDAATIIARGLGKQPGDTKPEQSIQRFVDKMNAKAKALGATETHFANPHGLDDPAHRTSAHDLGIIGAALAGNPTLLRITGTVTYDGFAHTVHTTNKLLYDGRYPAVVGGKTGQTDDAGYTLIEIASRNGRALLSVELGTTAESFWTDAMTLLNYGFATPTASRPKASSNLPPAGPLSRTGGTPAATDGTGTASATFIPVPPGAAGAVNRAEHPPQATFPETPDTPTAVPVPATSQAVQMLPVADAGDRARLRFVLFVLLAAIVTGVLFARRAGLRRALDEARHEWRTALADPPHLVTTTVLPLIAATGGAATPSVSSRWEQLGVRIPKEELEVARAYALRAVRQASAGDRDAARQAFRRAVALDPKMPWGKIGGFWDLPPTAYIDLAHAMIETAHPADARSMLTVAALAHPRDAEIRALEARLTGRPIPPPFRIVSPRL